MLELMHGTRVVALPTALDAALKHASWPKRAVSFRIAPDELVVFAEIEPTCLMEHDRYAIVEYEGSFFGQWVTRERGAEIFSRHCEWPAPHESTFPATAQGAIAGLPLKVVFRKDRWLFLVQSPFRAEFEERVLS